MKEPRQVTVCFRYTVQAPPVSGWGDLNRSCEASEANDDRRSSLEDQYRAVSAAIVAEDLDAIAAIGYRSFAARAEEVRDVWKANFQSVAEYVKPRCAPLDLARRTLAGDGAALCDLLDVDQPRFSPLRWPSIFLSARSLRFPE